jgi:cytochrome oxidase assembly protein ShyY1
VHVLTPFYNDGGEVILVNRGWLPLTDRTALPAVTTPAESVQIKGRLAPLPIVGRKLGEPDRLDGSWPQLVTYLEIEDVAAGLDEELVPRLIWLDSQDKHGFQGRDWSPVVMTPQRHRAYAFQWFSLATAAVIIWIVVGMRSNRKTPA